MEGVGPRLSGADADVSSTEEASGSRLLATSAASPLAESLSTQHRLCAVCSFFMLRIEVHASYVKSLQCPTLVKWRKTLREREMPRSKREQGG